jgi:hypothetical protein
LLGKKQNAFAAAGKVLDLWRSLSMVDFKGKRQIYGWLRVAGWLGKTEYRVNQKVNRKDVTE